VVAPESSGLLITSPQPGFINWPAGEIEPITIEGQALAGTTEVTYTIHDKGIVMGQGSLTPQPDGSFTLVYDANALHADFPMLSLTAREGLWEGLADQVTIHFLAVGSSTPRAGSVVLIGEQVFVRDSGYQIMLPLVIR
jgi:hypothetical protein